MKTITTTTGSEIVLDGDLLAIMETLYREVNGTAGARAVVRGHDP
jgi:hypothetical protein